jgi:carbonic anhydrase
MKYLPELFANNRAWAERMTHNDPYYFERLAETQQPDYLWIGCADSRVPANEIVGLGPGELFVHRNIANVVHPIDHNVLSVLQYSVEFLRVSHIIVCGHYGCGGVQAALRVGMSPPLENWLEQIRSVYRSHREEIDALPDEKSRWWRLCELNVMAQWRQFVKQTLCVRLGNAASGLPFMVGSTIFGKDCCGILTSACPAARNERNEIDTISHFVRNDPNTNAVIPSKAGNLERARETTPLG